MSERLSVQQLQCLQIKQTQYGISHVLSIRFPFAFWVCHMELQSQSFMNREKLVCAETPLV